MDRAHQGSLNMFVMAGGRPEPLMALRFLCGPQGIDWNAEAD
jgi:hypothetical protein